MKNLRARIGQPIFCVLSLLLSASSFSQVDAGLPNLPSPEVPKMPTADEFADQQMVMLDKNGDRKISWQEFSAKLRAAFDDMDKKKRGYITREDIKAAYLKAIAEMRPQTDDEE